MVTAAGVARCLVAVKDGSRGVLRVTAAVVSVVLLAAASTPVATAEPRVPPDRGSPEWLLPWPQSDTAGVLVEDTRDVVPADPAALTADEALVMYEQAQLARVRRDASVDRLALQRNQRDIAEDRAEKSGQRASIARTRADNAVADLNALARSAYITGTDPTLAALSTATSTEQFTGILTLPTQVQRASEFQANEIDRLNRSAELAQETAIADAFAVQEAETRINATRTSIIQDTRLARAYDAAYLEFINSTSGQAQVGPDGCPTETLPGVLRDGAEIFTTSELCQRSVLAARTPQAAEAVKWAFSKLGAPYACKGIGRMGDFRFDCSSLVSRAYAETSGIPIANATYAHSTRSMMPWDGYSLDPHYFEVPPEDIAPGDLLLFRSCDSEPCAYQHVTMVVADGFMLHTNRCGDVAHVTRMPTLDASSDFVVARRVLFLDSEQTLQQEFLDSIPPPTEIPAAPPINPTPGEPGESDGTPNGTAAPPPDANEPDETEADGTEAGETEAGEAGSPAP